MKLLLAIMTALVLTTTATWASTDYLSVPGWENCSKAISQAPYKFFCLPPSKPANCSESSWATLTKGQLLPFCPLCPKK